MGGLANATNELKAVFVLADDCHALVVVLVSEHALDRLL
jgi:hypothetical protein